MSVDGFVAQMIARRKEALALLDAARAARDQRLMCQYEKIVHGWDVLLAEYGVPSED